MPLITWSDAYGVGIKRIDDQHKRLFAIVNELHEAMLLLKGDEALKGILSDLLGYAQYHFAAEESIMKDCGYPNYAIQKEAHDAFAARVHALFSALRAGESRVSVEAMEFLRDWLDGHIRRTDRTLGIFLNSKGLL